MQSARSENYKLDRRPRIDDPIAMVRDIDGSGAINPNTEVFYYTKDNLGSVRDLTNGAGELVQRYRYTAYGETTIEKDDGHEFIESPYAFTSRELDQETGFYFYRSRYYDPSTGRFISEDPVGFGGGDPNLYRYVFNNPLRYTDPNGLTTVVAPIPRVLVPDGSASSDPTVGDLFESVVDMAKAYAGAPKTREEFLRMSPAEQKESQREVEESLKNFNNIIDAIDNPKSSCGPLI